MVADLPGGMWVPTQAACSQLPHYGVFCCVPAQAQATAGSLNSILGLVLQAPAHHQGQHLLA